MGGTEFMELGFGGGGGRGGRGERERRVSDTRLHSPITLHAPRHWALLGGVIKAVLPGA